MYYYLYDPVAHGADPDTKYPLVVVFHGAGNGMEEASAFLTQTWLFTLHLNIKPSLLKAELIFSSQRPMSTEKKIITPELG